MNEEELFREIDYLGSVDEYLEFIHEHFALEPEAILLAMDHEKYCDYGCGFFLDFIKKNPQFNTEEFQEYVIVHNKADRDSGELADIAEFEILRLAAEFAKEKGIKWVIQKRAKIEPPTWEEVLAADGMGGIWEEELAKKKRPQDYPKGRFHLDDHARGKSVSDLTPIIVRRANGEVEVIPINLLFPNKSKESQIEVKDGTMVWGKNGWESIKWIMRHQVSEHLLRVNTHGSSIDVTFDHSLFQQNETIESKNLRTGDKIDQIELPLIEGKDDVDKEFAWMLGFWVAEGSYKRGYSQHPEFSQSGREPLDRIAKWAKTYGFKLHIYKTNEEYKLGLMGLRIFEQFSFRSPHFLKTRTARLKKIPPFIFKWNKESKTAFFDGYLVGDGQRIGKTGISFATVSQTLAQGLILIAKIIYPDRIPSISLQDNTFRIRLVHRKGTKGRLANSLYPFRNEIKKILESKSVNFAGNKNPNFKDGHYLGTRFIKKQYWIYRHKRYVYDIETKSHSFQAGIGNILAHNSSHKDLRIKRNDHLIGWTVTDQVEGAIDERIDSVSDWKKYPWNDPKIFKFQPDMGDRNVKCVAIKKSQQPLVWLNVRNVAFPPGSVGATKLEWGVFRAVDDGMAYQGTQKPYFNEWFLDGKHFKGRLIFRLIPVRPEWRKKPKAKLQWQTWLGASTVKGQLPYLLSPRGRSRKDVAPPSGESWLPPEWETKIKSEYRWWPDTKSKNEKIKLIDEAYNDLIERKEIKARKLKLAQEARAIRKLPVFNTGIAKALDTQTAGEGYEWKSEGYAKWPIKRVKIHQVNLNEMKELKKAKFLLRRHHFKGQFVVRGMSVDHWDLVLDKRAKCLDEFSGMENNPLDHPEGVSCLRKDCCIGTPEGKPNREWMKFYGKSIPPNHPEWGNPHKRIKAYMNKVDEGSVNIISDTDTFVSFMFHGKELKGYWIAKRESPKAEIWVFSKSSLPGEPRKEIKHAAQHKDCINFDSATNRCNFKNKSVDPEGTACPDFIPRENIQQAGYGRGRGGQRRSWNSPTFAYVAVYSHEPDHWIPGRTGDPEKEWKRGIMIDEHLKPEVFDELDKIKEIEVRSSCEGHSKERVSYIVFRLKPKFDKYAKKISVTLDKLDGVYSKSDVGTENRPRIVCAGKTWYSQKSWAEWWDKLPSRIALAVKEILGETKQSLLALELKQKLKDFKGNILTEEERKFRLENFQKVIAATRDGTDSEPLDEILIPYLEKINSFSFLVTTQSCWGHNKPKNEKHAHFDFRSKLTEKDTIDKLIRPMTDKFQPGVGCELMLECDRLRYCLWLDNKNWKKQFEHFLELLKGISPREAKIPASLVRHRRDKCMECDAPPKYEFLWAEGAVHGWLCSRHFRAWALKNMKERKAEGYACDINMVREVQNGMAAKKWKDNTNPDIWPKLRATL